MGFGREARRVRDSSLPRRYRVHALGSCIQISKPIGFNATWSYLEAKVGRSWRDPDFLLPALDQLEAVRRRHAVLQAEYADWRRAQKGFGLRIPPRAESTPSTPRRWHGDERLGAAHALRTWRRLYWDPALSAHTRGSRVLAAVDRGLTSSAPPSAVDRAELQRCLMWARRQIYVVGREHDPVEYGLASTTLYLLGQLHLLLFGEPRLGAEWHFEAG